MFQICDKAPLFLEYNVQYNSIAFDGDYYYLTVKCKPEIVKLSKNLKLAGIFKTDRAYTALCYAENDNCFYAVSRGNNAEIFKLMLRDCRFKEVEVIHIEGIGSAFSSIAYCCDDQTLLVSCGEQILKVNVKYPQNFIETKYCQCAFISGVASVAPCFLYCCTHAAQKIIVADIKGDTLAEHCMKDGYCAEQILYCGRHGKCDCIQILASKQGCSYLIEAKLPKEIMGELCHCTVTSSTNACCKSGNSMEDLENCDCKIHSLCDCGCGNCGSCGNCVDDCKPCPPPCPPPYPPCPPHPPCPPPHPHPCAGCSSVLESIALVEAAISHILNAEGEKLQKVISTTSSVDELLCTNQSVQKTIIHVTHLEQTLYAKLDALMKCCKNCRCKKDGDYDCGGDSDCDYDCGGGCGSCVDCDGGQDMPDCDDGCCGDYSNLLNDSIDDGIVQQIDEQIKNYIDGERGTNPSY